VSHFEQEAAVLEGLQHPNIVRFYGLERHSDLIFILMEYIEGQTLRETLRARGNPLSPDEMMHYLRPVAAALHYAHQKKIYHCDVKASNILADASGLVRIGDFGIAHVMGEISTRFKTVGTPTHMAPEQCKGEPVDARTDVYGLGVTVYEMATSGHVPFTGDTASTTGTKSERVRYQHLYELPPSPRQFNSGLTVQVEAVIMRSLAKEPAARYPSAIAMLNAFEVALHASSAQSRTERRPAVLGSPGADLTVLRGEWTGYTFRLQGESCHIGRSRYNDVRLSQASVSRRHAVIRWSQGCYWIQDMESLHGTYLNGKEVRAQKLTNGDEIRIGDTVLEFRIRS
jgi:serine/threonine protein kinase